MTHEFAANLGPYGSALVIVNVLAHGNFLEPGNITNVLRQITPTAIMAVVLYSAGYGWIAPTGSGNLVEALHCADAILLGAGVYLVALLLCWAAAGCPEGAETFLLNLVPMGLGARARKFLVKT